VQTFAASLRGMREGVQQRGIELGAVTKPLDGEEPMVDMVALREQVAVDAVRSDATAMQKLKNDGLPWRGVQAIIEKALPETTPDKAQEAYQLVPAVLDNILGPRAAGRWHTFKAERSGATWVRAVPKP
jgi:hypothetical protein